MYIYLGDDIAYIYPDMKMCIRGKFSDEKLVSGQVCQLLGCTEKDGIKKPVFSECSGQTYEYEFPSIKNIANHPTIRYHFFRECDIIKAFENIDFLIKLPKIS